MKILYVLVSSSDDFYADQALLSILSAKFIMPNMPISILMDDDTKKRLEQENNEILKQVDEIKTVHFKRDIGPVFRSRFLKTSMRELVSGDVLYVDVDTLWVNPIDESDFSADIMGVPDGHVECSNLPGYDRHVCLAKQIGFELSERFFINGGVLFLRDTCFAHDFMKQWNHFWQYSCEHGVLTDQESLNYVNSQMGGAIVMMPNCYNVQISFTIRYLMNAKLIHYFGSYFPTEERFLFVELQKQSFWKNLKRSNNGLDLTRKIAENPEKIFSISKVSRNVDYELKKHPSYGLLCDVIESKKKSSKFFLGFLDLMTLFVSWFWGLFKGLK